MSVGRVCLWTSKRLVGLLDEVDVLVEAGLVKVFFMILLHFEYGNMF